MTPISLTIQNFRGFRAAKTFEFPQGPGLFFMQGRNEVEPRLGGNGAGKSTIWEALYWLINGRTTEGLLAGDVCNWETSKGVSVSLCYRAGGVDYEVTRTWGPNSWVLRTGLEDGQEQDLAKLTGGNPFLQHLGLGNDVFLHAIMMAQSGSRFLDLKKDAQAELFSKILDQDKWLDFSTKASRMASAQDAVCRRLESEVSHIQGRASEQRDYSREIEDWEARRTRELDDLERDYEELLAKRKAAKVRYGELQSTASAGDGGAIKAAEARVAELQKQAAAEREYHQDMKHQLALVEGRLRGWQDQLHELEKTGVCQLCGTTLGADGMDDKHGRRMMGLIEAAGAEVQRLMPKAKAAKARLDELLDAIDEAVSASHKARADWDRAQADVRAAKRELDLLDQDLDKLEGRADRIQSEKNPFLAMQKEAQERARSTQAALSKARQGLDEALEKYSLYGLWVRGFKEIRLKQLGEALAELEIEVNSSMAELGLDGWEVNFYVDRETKGGKVQRGFTVMVKSPGSKKAVPWASWSGGEKQRLRLAGEMGLSNLARSRLGVLLPLEVWDEPSTGLSEAGIHDLMTCLERRARVEGRQIWVVDHTTHEFGGWSGRVTVVKDAQGSRIEQ
jgi:DNA repair exonuclease SbcCD ATPase subunit